MNSPGIDFLRDLFDTLAHNVPLSTGNHILYFGLTEEKGVDQLAEPARRVPHALVVVVDDGLDRAKFEQAAARLDNLRVGGPAWGDGL